MEIYDRSHGGYARLGKYMIARAGLCSVMDIYDRSRGVYARLGIYAHSRCVYAWLWKYMIARTEVMLG